MYFAREFIYREQLLVWIIADLIKIIGLCFVWIASSLVVDDMTKGYVITYYLLIMLISKLTTDYTLELGVRDIIYGRFTNLLIKPFNYLTEYIGINLGGNILRFIIFLPGFILGAYLAQHYGYWVYDFNPSNMFLSLVAVGLGFLINFFIGNTVTLLAFVIKEMDSVRIFFYNITAILSGEFIPFIFLPYWALYTVQILPFRYTLSFPVEILLGGMNHYEVETGLIFASGWLVITYGIYKVYYSYIRKRYESEGI